MKLELEITGMSEILKFIICINMVLFFISDSSEGVYGNDNAEDSSFDIHINDGLLTMNVKNVPLKKVLKKITNNKGIKMVSLVSGEELIMANFSSLPIEKGLKRLLSDYNFAFVYSPEKSKNREHVIRKVIILSKIGKNQDRKVQPIIISKKKSSLESLSIALNDEDFDVREEALYSLAELKDERSIDLLTEALLNDKDGEIRAIAAMILGSIGSEIDIDSLIHALQDEDSEVRLSAVEAIGSIGGVRAIQVLEGSLSDEDDHVSEIAAEELKRLKGK